MSKLQCKFKILLDRLTHVTPPRRQPNHQMPPQDDSTLRKAVRYLCEANNLPAAPGITDSDMLNNLNTEMQH
jgi:hypothetical protein